ncbi:MAG: FeoB-associated Cys-rich membrane protein [Agathobacter sp.]|nr:FeoB-associated Cys-rich membrane protein [Agathobacter sp.]
MLVAAVFFAVRSIWKNRKNGGSSCGGDCTNCKGCH